MPTYLKSKYILFFISISGRIRIRNIFPAQPDPDPWEKCRILIPGLSRRGWKTGPVDFYGPVQVGDGGCPGHCQVPAQAPGVQGHRGYQVRDCYFGINFECIFGME